MNFFRPLAVSVSIWAALTVQAQDFFDRVDDALTIAAFNDNVRARLSGTLDLEAYHFQQPAPGLIASKSDALFNPRFTLFLDAQIGPSIYFFAESRLDRGFDPSDHGAAVRLDEYALRLTPWDDGRFSLQIGKFATVVGNWVPRHLSWDNPFVTAPLVYENVTAIEDKAGLFLGRNFSQALRTDKYEFNPVIWGPNYASGVSVSGRVSKFDYAAEMKNVALAARPESWDITAIGFTHPTFNAHVGFRPNQTWNVGVSASDGAYLRPEAEATLPRGRDIGDYHERLLGQDIGFAWHHWQIWAEFYEASFEVPRASNADTFAYYLEAKYKFTPQLFAALRWNQQLFDRIDNEQGGSVPWGRDIWRTDAAMAYRFTPHTQLKLQYAFQKETSGSRDDNHTFAAQFTVRF